jgi:hypothetical protein
MSFFTKGRFPAKRSPCRRTRPVLEELETRLVPYTTSGNAWPFPNLITISFVPDNTTLGSNGSGYIYSNLFASFNAKFGSATTWQNQILKAAQTWAQQANINFAVVADNGTGLGLGNYQQGDPGMGDIRIGGFDFGGDESTLAQAYTPPPVNNYSAAGDIQLNTGAAYHIGTTYDLYTVAVHEIGHALGLLHSSDSYADLYYSYQGRSTGLYSDDVAGIQAIYGARPADTPNNSFANATDITAQIDPSALTAQLNNQNLATPTSADYFKFTAPVGVNSTIKIQVQSSGLSLLSPVLTVYASNQTTVLGTASGANRYGATITVTLNNVTAGQQFYIKVSGTSSPSNDGVYALTLNLGAGALPAVALPNTQLLNGSPITGGGGSLEVTDGPGQTIDVFGANEAPPGTTPAPAAAVPTVQVTPNASTTTNVAVLQQAALLAHASPTLAAPAPVPGLTAPTLIVAPLPVAPVATQAAFVSASFRSGGSGAPSEPEAEMIPAPTPVQPEKPEDKPDASGVNMSARTRAVQPEPCDLFFRDSVAVERLRDVDAPVPVVSLPAVPLPQEDTAAPGSDGDLRALAAVVFVGAAAAGRHEGRRRPENAL